MHVKEPQRHFWRFRLINRPNTVVEPTVRPLDCSLTLRCWFMKILCFNLTPITWQNRSTRSIQTKLQCVVKCALSRFILLLQGISTTASCWHILQSIQVTNSQVTKFPMIKFQATKFPLYKIPNVQICNFTSNEIPELRNIQVTKFPRYEIPKLQNSSEQNGLFPISSVTRRSGGKIGATASLKCRRCNMSIGVKNFDEDAEIGFTFLWSWCRFKIKKKNAWLDNMYLLNRFSVWL